MKRILAFLALFVVVAGACNDPNEDADKLRAFVRSSEREPRTVTFRAASESQEFAVTATVQDELRYAMVLKSGGRDVMDYVVRDDALGVRLRDPAFGARLANVLGDPTVDAALKAGRWVVDPAGAPPFFSSDVGAGGETSGDPFREAHESIRLVEQWMGQASETKEWNLEDITYRSALDPWRYPLDEREIRYDLIRPFLPSNEAQTIGAQGDIGPAQFRKTSVFVRGRRVTQVCSLVDVRGHEEFRELAEAGPDSNPFLAQLLKRIEEKETAIPIEERYVFMSVDYRDASVDIPPDATTGKLETLLTALKGGFTAGLLRPAGRVETKACRRT